MEHTCRAQIGVQNLEILVRKGLYPSEQLLENRFLVSAEAAYDTRELPKGSYLNYEKMAEMIQLEMFAETALLETTAGNIVQRILDEWPVVSEVWVRISKQNPAFTALSLEAVVVEMRASR